MPSYVTTEHFNRRLDDLITVLDEKFVTKDEFHSFRSENATRQDEMVTILRRLDQERVFTIERIRRIELDVSMLKEHLKLA